jgi:hypothetical protein
LQAGWARRISRLPSRVPKPIYPANLILFVPGGLKWTSPALSGVRSTYPANRYLFPNTRAYRFDSEAAAAASLSLPGLSVAAEAALSVPPR